MHTYHLSPIYVPKKTSKIHPYISQKKNIPKIKQPPSRIPPRIFVPVCLPLAEEAAEPGRSSPAWCSGNCAWRIRDPGPGTGRDPGVLGGNDGKMGGGRTMNYSSLVKVQWECVCVDIDWDRWRDTRITKRITKMEMKRSTWDNYIYTYINIW